MNATRTWGTLTGRTVTPKTQNWIADLVERFGDDEVAAAIEAEARAQPTKMGSLLPRARDRLARLALADRDAPVFVDRDWLMAIVRGERLAPEGRYYYDSSALDRAEYDELVEFVALRQSREGVPA